MKIITPLKGRLALILPFLLLLPVGAAYATSPEISGHTYDATDADGDPVASLGTITFATEVDEDTDEDGNLDIDETDSSYTGWLATVDGDSNFDVGADKDSSGGWSLGDVDYNNSTGLCEKAIASNCSPRTLDEQDIADLTALVGNGSVTSTDGGILINDIGPVQSEDLDGDGNFDRYAEDLDNDGNPDKFEDLNRNGVLDTGEDTDHNGVWSVGDVDINNDLGFGYNYTVDGNEADTTFLGTPTGLDTDEDVNNNNVYDYLEDIDSDGIADVNEDADLDGHFDQGEDGNGNKKWDVGEIDINGSACVIYGLGCDEQGDPVSNYVVVAGDGLEGTAFGMEFTEDLNLNGVFDLGEDLDDDGRFDQTHEDQNNDGNWDLVEDQTSDGYWSVGDIDLNDSLGLGYGHTVTQDNIDGVIATALSDAESNGVNGVDFLNGDLDGNLAWSVGDIDYGQELSIVRDPSAGVWDPLTQDDIDAISNLATPPDAPSSYYIAGLDNAEDTNGINGLSLFDEDLNNDKTVYFASEDMDSDGTLDLIEDQDSDGVWSVGDIDFNNDLGYGYGHEVTGTETDTTFLNTDTGLDLSELDAGDGDTDFDIFSEDIDADGFFDSISEDFDGDGTQDLAYEDQDSDGVLDLVDETTMTVENQNNEQNALNVIAKDLQINGDSVATQDSLDNVAADVANNKTDIDDLFNTTSNNTASINENTNDIDDNYDYIIENADYIEDLENDRQAMIDASGFTVAPQQLGENEQIVAAEELAPSWVVEGTNYLDDTSTILESVVELDTQVNDVADDLATEVSRATGAEGVLTQDLATEVTRATAAEAVLTQDLATEVTRATAAEAVLTQDLATEVTRATAAEAVLTQDLATEVTRATAAEAVLTQDLATEVTRATAAEAVLTQDLAAEVTRATAAEAVLTQDLAAEVTRATAAEAVLTQDLAAEVTRATAAEAVLTQDLAAEVTRATAAEATNRGLIDTNSNLISANRGHLNRLDESVDMLRSGVAMSMALAGMPTTGGNGTNFAIGAGSFDGESAVAVGLTHKTRKASYNLGITYAGGETGVAAGAAWKIGK